MIGKKMQEALVGHVAAELYSANLYLAMSAYCEAKAYKGFGRWLRVQYFEELDHAHKMLDYVVTRGGTPVVGAVKAPPKGFGTILGVFEAVLVTRGDGGEFVRGDEDFQVAIDDLGHPTEHDPVFAKVVVHLRDVAAAGLDLDALDLDAQAFLEYGIGVSLAGDGEMQLVRFMSCVLSRATTCLTPCALSGWATNSESAVSMTNRLSMPTTATKRSSLCT